MLDGENNQKGRAAAAPVPFARSPGLCGLAAHCDTRNLPPERIMQKLGMVRVAQGERTYAAAGETAREWLLCPGVGRGRRRIKP